jgi:hypothetical protein
MVALSGPASRDRDFASPATSSDNRAPVRLPRTAILTYVLVENRSQRKCVELTAEHCFLLKRGWGSYLASALPIMDLDDFQTGGKRPRPPSRQHQYIDRLL